MTADLLSPFEPAITLDDQIDCVQREIGYRVRVYQSLVAARRMKKGEADRQLALMRAVLATVEDYKRLVLLVERHGLAPLPGAKP